MDVVGLLYFLIFFIGGFMNHKSKQTYERIDELSQRTGLPKSWWYSKTRETGPGCVPRVKAGKYLLFIPHEVDEWLMSQKNRLEK
jgi:predicted DNA-binding transcriptional regulator AlpA